MVRQIKCLRRWPGRVVGMDERYEIKVSEFSKVTCKSEYERILKQMEKGTRV